MWTLGGLQWGPGLPQSSQHALCTQGPLLGLLPDVLSPAPGQWDPLLLVLPMQLKCMPPGKLVATTALAAKRQTRDRKFWTI